MRPRLVSDDDLLNLILEAFADLGFDGTSVRALCRHLGVSHNLIHQRYGTKDQMWYAAVDHGFRSLAADMVISPQVLVMGDEVELLRSLIRRYLQLTRQRPALLRIVAHEAALGGPRFDHILKTYLRPTHELVEQILTRLQEDGRVRPGPVSGVYYFLVTHGLGSMASLPGLAAEYGGDSDEAIELAADVVLAGLTAGAADRQVP